MRHCSVRIPVDNGVVDGQVLQIIINVESFFEISALLCGVGGAVGAVEGRHKRLHIAVIRGCFVVFLFKL